MQSSRAVLTEPGGGNEPGGNEDENKIQAAPLLKGRLLLAFCLLFFSSPLVFNHTVDSHHSFGHFALHALQGPCSLVY